MTALLQDKTALVTGGAAGIGRGIAACFAEHGAHVIIADSNPEHLAQTGAYFDEQKWSFSGVECDVTRSEEVKALMERIDREHDGLSILVNNVGDFLNMVKPLEEMSDEEIDQLFAMNLRHVLVCSRDAIPLLKKRAPGASIISISSIEGCRGMPNITPYGAYKSGVSGFTRSLALELGPAGIRVNAIAPETTETQQVQPKNWMAPEDYTHVREWIPLGRFGVPQDIAGCALFLASELAAWVTGSILLCDGGALAAAGWYRTPEGQWTNTPLISGSGIKS